MTGRRPNPFSNALRDLCLNELCTNLAVYQLSVDCVHEGATLVQNDCEDCVPVVMESVFQIPEARAIMLRRTFLT